MSFDLFSFSNWLAPSLKILCLQYGYDTLSCGNRIPKIIALFFCDKSYGCSFKDGTAKDYEIITIAFLFIISMSFKYEEK